MRSTARPSANWRSPAPTRSWARHAPIDVAGRIAAAYHRVYPLQSEEVDLLFDLIAMRLVTSVTLSASRRERVKDNAYLNISEAPAWAMLERLRAMDPALATGILRHACGFEAAPGAKAAVAWIAKNRDGLRPVLDRRPALLSKAIVPFGDPQHPIAAASAARRPDEAERLWRAIAEQDGVELGIGPWGEERPVYSSDAFQSVFAPDQRRSLHLGLDLFAPAGSNVRTPLDGIVVDLFETDVPLDYGHAVLLRHAPDGLVFYSLWGHLSAQTVRDRRIGDRLRAGDVIGQLGDTHENGNWQPHVHIQLITYEPERAADVIGAGEGSYREVWRDLFPDPMHFVGLPHEALKAGGKPKDELLEDAQEQADPQSQHLLSPAAEDRARRWRVADRRDRARLSRLLQQRRAAGSQQSRRSSRRWRGRPQSSTPTRATCMTTSSPMRRP